ncbi:MAG: hypothetical protein ACETVR_04700 [Candidatus Bathyarchaeia archaeon]
MSRVEATDWDKLLHERGLCCVCGGSLRDSEYINFVQLNKYAKWKYPAYGNILARDPDKKEAKRAMAVLCDRCIEEKRDPRLAVEFRGEGEIMYHPLLLLEDAEPITAEDLEEPALVFGEEYFGEEEEEDIEEACPEGYGEDEDCRPENRRGIEFCEFLCPFKRRRDPRGG